MKTLGRGIKSSIDDISGEHMSRVGIGISKKVGKGDGGEGVAGTRQSVPVANA